VSSRADLRGLFVDAWQQESLDLEPAIERLARLVSEQEPRIHALEPEEGRFDRLRHDLAASPPGPLARVPIGIKDIFHVDGLVTRAGSRLPVGELSGDEASSVTTLKRAGGVILGKTVSTEFAYFAPGPTRNPHDPEHTPGGSSSGSAAAVAAGYCPLALGTQTIGSISRPASYCGVVGFKPTYGRIAATGVIPLSASLDHIGLFTNRISDAAIAASVLCQDWAPVQPARRPILGIPRGPYLDRASPMGLDHFQRVCSALQSLEWEIRSVDLFADFAAIAARHQSILAAEVARAHQDWFSRFGDLYHSKTRELIEQGQGISETALAAALEEKDCFRDMLAAQTVRAGVDLWLSPAASGPAPRGLDSTGDPVMNLPWTQAGLPTLSLPAGVVGSGLPMGLQVTGRGSADEDLMAWGKDLEKALESLQ